MPAVIVSPIAVGRDLEDIVYDRLKKLEQAKGGLAALDVLFRIAAPTHPLIPRLWEIDDVVESFLKKYNITVKKTAIGCELDFKEIIANCLMLDRGTGLVVVVEPGRRLIARMSSHL